MHTLPPVQLLEGSTPPPPDSLLQDERDRHWGSAADELRPRLIQAVNALLRALLKHSENPGYAEDIVSETLTAAYEKWDRYDAARGRLYPWLLQIARNRTFDFLRRHRELKSERSFDEGIAYGSWQEAQPELLYDNAARPSPKTLAVRRALKRLRRYDQELLICRFGNALDYDEIESYFNFTVKKSTLRVQVMRAQSRLRRELAKEPVFRELLSNG
jgi:RNA polymerase sigma-70 factor, ECF subfamily